MRKRELVRMVNGNFAILRRPELWGRFLDLTIADGLICYASTYTKPPTHDPSGIVLVSDKNSQFDIVEIIPLSDQEIELIEGSTHT